MTYGKQPVVSREIDWVVDEDKNIIGSLDKSNRLVSIRDTFLASGQEPLLRWKAALARMYSGQGNAKIACIGDSITLGNGAGTGTANQVNARSKSYPVQLASLLRNLFGQNVDADHNYNYNNGLQSPLTITDFNPRITLGTGWIAITNNAAGSHFANNTDSASFLDFAVTKAINRADIVCRRLTGTVSFGVHLESQGIGTEQIITVTGNAALGPILQTVSFASPSTTTDKIRIRRNASNVGIAAVTAYNSATPEIQVANWGWAGVSATGFADPATTYSFAAAKVAGAPLVLEAHKVDLVLCVLGHNDINGAPATNIDSFKNDLQQIIDACRQENGTYYGADIIFGTCFPSARSGDVAGLARFYNDAIKEIALKNNAPVLDINKGVGVDYAVANKFFPFADGTHPTAQGYAEEALGFYKIISQALD